MKQMILSDAKRTGALKSNMDSSNVHLKAQLPTPAPQFTLESYQAFLLTGTLPKEFPNTETTKVTASAPQFVMGRAALPGATCWNDVPLIGYPTITVAGKTESTKTTILPADTTPMYQKSESGDTSRNAGGVGMATLGIDFSKIVNNITQEVVKDITKNVTNNITTGSTVETRSRTEPKVPDPKPDPKPEPKPPTPSPELPGGKD
jgi:hypothetical protein